MGGDTCAFASIDRRSQLEPDSLNVTIEAPCAILVDIENMEELHSSQSAHISAQFAGYESLKEQAQMVGPGGSFDEVNKLGMEYQTTGQHSRSGQRIWLAGLGFSVMFWSTSGRSLRPNWSRSVGLGWLWRSFFSLVRCIEGSLRGFIDVLRSDLFFLQFPLVSSIYPFPRYQRACKPYNLK